MIYIIAIASQMFLNGQQDLHQKPTPWDAVVQSYCADWANERHLKRGGGGHPAFAARWMQDILACQKKLGFMARDRREI